MSRRRSDAEVQVTKRLGTEESGIEWLRRRLCLSIQVAFYILSSSPPSINVKMLLVAG